MAENAEKNDIGVEGDVGNVRHQAQKQPAHYHHNRVGDLQPLSDDRESSHQQQEHQ